MPWTVNYSIADAKGAKATTSLNLPDALAFDLVEEGAQEFATLINALVTGAIISISITKSVELPAGLRATPVTNSDVEEGARFQFLTQNRFYTALRLPTFAESKIATNSKAVNLADADVTAFVDAMLDGVTLTGGTTGEPVDSRGEDIVSLSFAREQFVSSR